MTQPTKTEGFWKRHLDKIGIGGSLFAALCCLGFPALLSVLSAIGLGFLINDAILLPLLVVFLLVTLAGLALGMRHHGSPWALVVGAVSAAAMFVFTSCGSTRRWPASASRVWWWPAA
jgi:mercuric ion transport protein